MRKRTTPPVALSAALLVAGCAQPSAVEQHQKALQSLAATSRAVASSWLEGYMTARSASQAFSQTATLLDSERSALSSQSRLLVDPRGATLSQHAEQLARAIAGLTDAIDRGDSTGVRQQLPLVPAFEADTL
jgi:hypothetical protein